MATPQPLTSVTPPLPVEVRGTQEYCHALVMLWARLESVVRSRGREALRDVRAGAEFDALRRELRLLASAPQALLPSVRLASGEQLRLAALAGSVASLVERADPDAPTRDALERAQDEVWGEIVAADAVDWIEIIVESACRTPAGSRPRHVGLHGGATS